MSIDTCKAEVRHALAILDGIGAGGGAAAIHLAQALHALEGTSAQPDEDELRRVDERLWAVPDAVGLTGAIALSENEAPYLADG